MNEIQDSLKRLENILKPAVTFRSESGINGRAKPCNIDSPAQLLASCSAQCGSFFYPLFECVTYAVDSVGIPVVARAFFKIISGKKFFGWRVSYHLYWTDGYVIFEFFCWICFMAKVGTIVSRSISLFTNPPMITDWSFLATGSMFWGSNKFNWGRLGQTVVHRYNYFVDETSYLAWSL